MSKNIYPNNFSHSCFKMASFIKHFVLILLFKMELLKEKIYTFLKLLKFYCFKCACPSISRPMLFPTLVFLLIGCLSLSWIGSLCFKPSFPINLCFPLSFGYLGALCFVRDVRPHVSKLDPKSLKCIFLGYSRVQKGYRYYYPSLRRYLVSADVTFVENTSFSQDPIHTSQAEDDDLLVYTLASLTSTYVPPLTKPPITLRFMLSAKTPSLEPSTSSQ